MKNTISIIILLLSMITCEAQEYMSPPSFALPTKNEQIMRDAFEIFKANKYLDFKGRDTIVTYINEAFYSKFDLNNYFSVEKDWKAILKEDTSNYKQDLKGYQYTYTDSNMIEQNNYRGNNLRFFDREKIYNAKGFLLAESIKHGESTKLIETISTTYKYDLQNRATEIIKTTINYAEKDTVVSKITAKYGLDNVAIKTNLGTFYCKFIVDPNSVGFISKLNGKETGEYFMYGLADKAKRISLKYCTEKLANKLKKSEFINKISALKAVKGTARYKTEVEEHEEIWMITLADKEPEQYQVNFKIIKTPKGLKIDEFSYKKSNN